MENVIISISGVISIFAISIFFSKWQEKKENKIIKENTEDEKSVEETNIAEPVKITGKNISEKKPKKSEFPINDDSKKSIKTKPVSKRGRKPKKDKGDDLILS